ncbi:MAG: hypothetical protein ACNA8W_12820 [Bradymonadaceae bacterium]
MNVLPLVPERRRQRSKEACTAITYQLHHILEQEGLRNFTLGDSQGLVVAGAGLAHESDVMAAYAPMLSGCVDRSRKETILAKVRQFVPGVFEDTYHVKSFRVDGEEFYLTLLGAPGIYQHVGVYRAVTGVRRILEQTVWSAA